MSVIRPLHFFSIKKHSLLYVLPSDPQTGSETAGQISGQSPIPIVIAIASVSWLPWVVVALTVVSVFWSTTDQYVCVLTIELNAPKIGNSEVFVT